MKRLITLAVLLFMSYTITQALEISSNDMAEFKLTETNIATKPVTITNIRLYPVEEEEMPNSYLSTGEIDFEEPETIIRRWDITFFVAIPITYYLTWNILNIRNSEMLTRSVPGYTYVDPIEEKTSKIYILLNTLFIPIFVAYEDFLYMRAQEAYPYQQEEQSTGIEIGVNLFNSQF